MMHFNIPQFSDVDQFLALVANKIGRLKKGGRPDRNGEYSCSLTFLQFRCFFFSFR